MVGWAERFRNIAGINHGHCLCEGFASCLSPAGKSKIILNCMNSSKSALRSEQQTADRENDAKNFDGLEEGTKRKFFVVLSPTSKSSPPNARKRRAEYPGQEISGV